MSRTYIQTQRIKNAYESYKKQLAQYNKTSKVATAPKLDFETYESVYRKYSSQGQKNISRTIIQRFNVTTTREEAREVANTIKESFKEKGLDTSDLLSASEIRGLSGQEKWDYFHGIFGNSKIGYRRANLAYNGNGDALKTALESHSVKQYDEVAGVSYQGRKK